jgi:hypothetical protein
MLVRMRSHQLELDPAGAGQARELAALLSTGRVCG